MFLNLLMKTLSFKILRIISIALYWIGGTLLVATCFATTKMMTYWAGGIALIFLVLGLLFQIFSRPSFFKSNSHSGDLVDEA